MALQSSHDPGTSASPSPAPAKLRKRTPTGGKSSRDASQGYVDSQLVVRSSATVPAASSPPRLPARIGCHLREHQKPFLASLNFVSTVVRVRKLNHAWVGSVIMTRIAGTSPDIFALLIMHAPSLGELLVVNNVHYNG